MHCANGAPPNDPHGLVLVLAVGAAVVSGVTANPELLPGSVPVAGGIAGTVVVLLVFALLEYRSSSPQDTAGTSAAKRERMRSPASWNPTFLSCSASAAPNVSDGPLLRARARSSEDRCTRLNTGSPPVARVARH